MRVVKKEQNLYLNFEQKIKLLFKLSKWMMIKNQQIWIIISKNNKINTLKNEIEVLTK